jgi:hypothetical protein
MSIKIDGLKGVQLAIDRFRDDSIEDIGKTLVQGAEKIEQKAKRFVPVNNSLLRNEIFSDTNNMFQTKVVSPTFYGPYVEFGTKKKFKANGRQAIASQFKGKGRGDYFDFLNAILDWVMAKGIGYSQTKSGNISKSKSSQEKMLQAAQAIANSIMRNGIKAQPFFFRAYDETLPVILRALKKYEKK